VDARIPSLNFSLYHRYVGHRELHLIGEGVPALIHAMKTSSLGDCSIVLMQSSVHDFARMYLKYCAKFNCSYCDNFYCTGSYLSDVRELSSLLATVVAVGSEKTKLFWKSDPFVAYNRNKRKGFYVTFDLQSQLELEVRKIWASSAANVKFINISTALYHLPKMHHNNEIHIGQAALLDLSPIPLLWTFVSTEVVLNHICSAEF